MLRKDNEARTIKISKNHEYFFAICARGKHSFVMIGVKDNETQELHHLFSIGKFFVMNDSTPNELYLKMLFSSAPSRLRMETLYYKENDRIGEYDEFINFFSYKAYVFSEQQYIRFLQHVSDCNVKASHIFAYQKDSQEADHTIFKYSRIPDSTGQEVAFSVNASFNSANNSCRNTAIEMTKDATNMMTDDKSISTSFLSALPYYGYINNGKLNQDFLVFPMPPRQDSILNIVYKHLESIPKKFKDNIDTYMKFNAVKKLYMLLDANKNITAFADILDEWERSHRILIDTQRGFSLFSQTATRKMLDELKWWIRAHLIHHKLDKSKLSRSNT